jgi:hypothetical protein
MSAYIAECPLCGEAKKEAAEDLVAFVVHIRRCHNIALSRMRDRCADAVYAYRGDHIMADKIRAEVSIT